MVSTTPTTTRKFPPSDWFRIREVVEQVFVIEEPGHVLSYLVNGRRRSALIDTGLGMAPLRPALQDLTRADIVVLNTHWHFDHVMGNPEFETIAIADEEHRLIQRAIDNSTLRRLYIDTCLATGQRLPTGFKPEHCHYPGSVATQMLKDGDRIDLGGRQLTALATPGHTRGSLSFLDDRTGALFCGDLIYEGTLYAHFTDSDEMAYQVSIRTLLHHDAEIRLIFPGHNRYPLSTDWLRRADRAFTLLIEGQLPVGTTSEWGAPVRRHHAGRLDILTPLPGTRGIDLAALLWPGALRAD